MSNDTESAFHESQSKPNTVDSIILLTRKKLTNRTNVGEGAARGSHAELLLKRFDIVCEARQAIWREEHFTDDNKLEEIEDIETIVLDGSLYDTTIEDLSLESIFYNPEDLIQALQKKLLDIYTRSPELVRLMMDKQVVGCHGTRSGALVDILIHGLRPNVYKAKHGLVTFTGTFDYAGQNFNQIATSFTSWANDHGVIHYTQPPAINVHNISGWMQSYHSEVVESDLSPQRRLMLSWAKQLSDFLAKPDKDGRETDIDTCLRADFPVICCVSKSSLKLDRTHGIASDVDYEFGIDDGVLPQELPIILVPADKIALAQAMAAKYNWQGRIADIAHYTTATP